MKRWTPTEIALLRARYPDTDTGALAAELGRSVYSIHQKANVLGLKKTAGFVRAQVLVNGAASRFRRGHVTWNKGRQYDAGGRSHTTRFRPGHQPHNTRDDKAMTRRSDGYWYIRISPSKWILYHRYLYEKTHGITLVSTDVVCFRDGNQDNLDPENLILTDRRGHMLINTIHRYPEDVKTAIRSLTKLKKAIRHATTGTTTTDPDNPADQSTAQRLV